MTLFASLLLTIAITWLLVRPHLSQCNTAFVPAPASEQLHDSKSRLVQLLKDLELDFATGKVSAEEHTQIKAQLGAELSKVLNTLDNNPA